MYAKFYAFFDLYFIDVHIILTLKQTEPNFLIGFVIKFAKKE